MPAVHQPGTTGPWSPDAKHQSGNCNGKIDESPYTPAAFPGYQPLPPLLSTRSSCYRLINSGRRAVLFWATALLHLIQSGDKPCWLLSGALFVYLQ